MPKSDTQYKPGGPGGPGRPKGSRNKLSEAFLKALADDFEDNGVSTIAKLRKSSPAQYCNVIAKLMPKLMELSGRDGGPIVGKNSDQWILQAMTPEGVAGYHIFGPDGEVEPATYHDCDGSTEGIQTAIEDAGLDEAVRIS